MMRCTRCGEESPRLTADQRRCPRCIRELDALYSPKPTPDFVPAWRRYARAKDLTERIA
jgi:hypothetical protein